MPDLGWVGYGKIDYKWAIVFGILPSCGLAFFPLASASACGLILPHDVGVLLWFCREMSFALVWLRISRSLELFSAQFERAGLPAAPVKQLGCQVSLYLWVLCRV
jgi:hypothetical protein